MPSSIYPPARTEPRTAALQSEPPSAQPAPGPPRPDAHGRMAVEAWADGAGTEPWKFKAVKTAKRWPDGLELTQLDYDAAIAWLDSDDCVAR